MGKKIVSFRDLRVYQEAFALQQKIFEITKSFPKEEMYALTDQIRRSSSKTLLHFAAVHFKISKRL
jgi:four helix bundle protein